MPIAALLNTAVSLYHAIPVSASDTTSSPASDARLKKPDPSLHIRFDLVLSNMATMDLLSGCSILKKSLVLRVTFLVISVFNAINSDAFDNDTVFHTI